MNGLKALTRRGDLRALSPFARTVVLVLAVLTPLVVAGVSVSAIQASDRGSASSPTVLPAAIVNDDQLVNIDQNGTQTPVLAGKLLVSQLTSSGSATGFDWTVTDAGTASDGLASGRFSAVVTIPGDFSKSYVSLSSSDPVQAQLQVQTNGAGSYVGELLASALSVNLQAALSSTVTEQFVQTTLGGFTSIQSSLQPAASGAGELAGYQSTLASGAGELATNLHKAADGAGELNTGAQAYAGIMQQIASATTDLPTYAGYLADGSSLVTSGIGLMRDAVTTKSQQVGTLAADQAAQAAQLRTIADGIRPDDPTTAQKLDDLADDIDGTAAGAALISGGLVFDSLGGDVLQYGSGLVTGGAQEFADDLPLLSTGLQDAATGAAGIATGTAGLADGLGQLATGTDQLAGGASQISTGLTGLANGLDQAVAQIPTYTPDKAKSVATVVAQPVVTTTSDVSALPGAGAAISAVAVPVALWIGALVLYLVLMPFTWSALLSTASTLRVVVSALRWPLLLGAAQAALVAGILLAVGVHPAHLVGSVVFAFVVAVSFVMLHQGLVALLGQGGRILSLALVVVQVVAAAVVIPAGLSAPAYTGLAAVLPLSHAITGMQLLATGGSLLSVLQEALVLLVFALIGLVLALVAATRARSRDLVAETASAPVLVDAGRDASPPADRPQTPGARGGPRGLTATPPAASGA
ncbi:hypothetical protein DVJ78_02885 [Humibacter sp. BT305]|nr:hypothetical protein DVJ78_02885 [Humibacter sp. BT305]